MQSFTTFLSLAAFAAPLVSAHGYVSTVVANGKTFNDVSNTYWTGQEKRAGWFAKNQDNGFVEPNSFGTSDIACHKEGTAGTTEIAVTAGSTMKVTWNTWPDSHKGPIINYLAKCSGADCTSAKAEDLSFWKIQQGALVDANAAEGEWVTDKMIANDFTTDVTIPANVKPGSYVLRHEIIALHSAGNANGAQSYPMCINLKISGSGSLSPPGKKAVDLYTPNDAGILYNLYSGNQPMTYKFPGQKRVWGKTKANKFRA